MLPIWIAFLVFVALMLALDLGVFHRKAHAVSFREAVGWSAVWVALALVFGVFIYFAYEHHWLGVGSTVDSVDGRINDGASAVTKYFTGYAVEKSLSVDNVFVIAMLFSFFAVPAIYQHRVLFWGIIGALALRGAMIGIGAKIIAEFHWVLYLFGAFLIITAAKMLLMKTGHSDPSKNPVVRLVRRLVPVTDDFHGSHFVVRAGSYESREASAPGALAKRDAAAEAVKPGALMLTPLSLSLVMIETTDLVFAVDSIPAIFAITADPFIVFTSNVFAMLGLRSLYFALAGMMESFRYLKVSLAAVLAIVGVKMLASTWLNALFGERFNFYLLGLILLILTSGVVASAVVNRREAALRTA